MRRVASLAAVTVASLVMSHAYGHAFLDHAAPAVGSTVHGPPAQVKMWFTERVEGAFSMIHVFDRSGKQIDVGDSHVDPADATVLLVSVPKLLPGTYKVTWRVLSVDTHVSEGDFTFDVAP